MVERQKLDYAAPPKRKKLVHPLIRVLVGILSLIFIAPTIDIVTGQMSSDGPVSNAIGIVITLSIAFYLGFVSITGRVKFHRKIASD